MKAFRDIIYTTEQKKNIDAFIQYITKADTHDAITSIGIAPYCVNEQGNIISDRIDIYLALDVNTTVASQNDISDTVTEYLCNNNGANIYPMVDFVGPDEAHCICIWQRGASGKAGEVVSV